jgi:hypothetical protein
MEKVQFTIEIHAPAKSVYEAMLGLNDKATYNGWTSAFNPTSTFEGSWHLGSKIYFIGTNEQGKRAGMISEIAEHIPAEFVSIRHYGIVDGDQEITSGELVEQWAGGTENYRYAESDGITTLTVTIDVVPEHIDYFNSTYPNALKKLKEIVES